jgi:hypothetical protein
MLTLRYVMIVLSGCICFMQAGRYWLALYT